MSSNPMELQEDLDLTCSVVRPEQNGNQCLKDPFEDVPRR